MKRKTYGYDRVRLADAYTVEELVSMAQDIRDDPANQQDGQKHLYIYTASARRKLDNLSYAIRYRSDMDRDA